MTWRVAPHPARRGCLTIQDDGEQYLALYVQPEVAELMAKAPELQAEVERLRARVAKP